MVVIARGGNNTEVWVMLMAVFHCQKSLLESLQKR
jgi:hypothetical protein